MSVLFITDGEPFQVDVSTGMPDGIAGIAACSSGTRLAVSCISGAVLQYTNAQSAQTGDIFVNHKSLPTIIPEFPPPRSPVNVLPYDPSPLGSKYVVRQTMEQFYSTGPLSSSMANTPWIEHQLLRRLPSKQISMTVSSVAKKRGGINTAPMPTPPYPPNSLIYGAGKTLYAQCDPRNSDATPASPSSSGTPSASVNQRNGRKGMTTTQYDMPEMYQRMRLIRGGKGHFKELDFNKHNKTSYVGLHVRKYIVSFLEFGFGLAYEGCVGCLSSWDCVSWHAMSFIVTLATFFFSEYLIDITAA